MTHPSTAPRILITTRKHERKKMYVQYVGEMHMRPLLDLGAVPIMVPSMPGVEAHVDLFMETADGVMLVEGKDVHPDRYGAPPESRPFIRNIDVDRDRVEFELVRRAYERDLPILGICRGAQIMNIAAGGTLYTDVHKDRPEESVNHVDYDNYHPHRHGLRLLPDNWLRETFAAEEIQVNSYHHQAVKKLADRFRPLAYAEDGVLEGFEDPNRPFVVGLQFHPERLRHEHKGHTDIFRRFVEAVCAHKTAVP